MKSLIRVVLFVLFCNIAAAESFTASVSKNPVEVGEQFQLTFSLNTSGSNFKAPGFPDFSVLSGPNQSTSMQFINGSMSQSLSYSYYLAAARPGKFTIQGVSIEANGKRITANPITIEVVKGQGNASGNSRSQNKDQQGADLSKSVFFKATASKTNVYQGEAILVTYKLYTKITLVNYSIDKMPAFDGFWSQDLDMPKQLEFRQENLNGVGYNVAEIKKVILFPQRSGTLKIDPMEGECIARIQVQRGRSNDPWSQFFNDPFFGMGQQDVQQDLRSEPISITVKELSGTAPEGFTGAVGNFKLEAFLDKPKTKTNEAVTLKVKISGKGNLKLIDPPKTQFPPDIEAYEPKTADNFSVTAGGVSGSRTFEYLLLPRNAGEYKIPPIQFAFFDPEKKAWSSLASQEFVLTVAQGEGTVSNTVPAANKSDLQLLGKDIRFIHTRRQSWQKTGEHFFGSLLFYLLLLGPLLLLLLFLFFYSRNKEMQGNLVLMKSRKANQMAKKRLKAAKACLDNNQKEQFYDEIFKALWGYTSDRLGIPVSGLSKESASAGWSQKGIEESLIQQLIATIDRCEFARFAPGGSGEMQQQYNETMSLISNLETALKGS